MSARSITFGLVLASLVLPAAKKPDDDTSNPVYREASRSLVLHPGKKSGQESGFMHPGVLLNRAQLEIIKQRVAKRVEPQFSAFVQLRESRWGALSYQPSPRQTVECGSYSKPNYGCKEEQSDSQAAYAHALLWYLTGEEAHARKAIEIMNAWSAMLTGGHTNANGPIQAAWTGAVWPRAAEIIRHAYRKWPDREVDRFRDMLITQYLPSLVPGTCENGNKELTMSEAIINIGVFIDSREVFEFGLKMWRGRAPAYIYLEKDGSRPLEAAGCGQAIWGNKGFFPLLVRGLLQESARDPGHANMGLAGMVNAAETARQQGVNLYREQADRIMAALEFQAQYLPPHNSTPPEKLDFKVQPTWEIAFNHFYNRLGYSLPRMADVLKLIRPTGVNHHMAWETLTHADIGSIGVPPVKE